MHILRVLCERTRSIDLLSPKLLSFQSSIRIAKRSRNHICMFGWYVLLAPTIIVQLAFGSYKRQQNSVKVKLGSTNHLIYKIQINTKTPSRLASHAHIDMSFGKMV